MPIIFASPPTSSHARRLCPLPVPAARSTAFPADALRGFAPSAAPRVGAGWAAVVLVTAGLLALAVSPPWLPPSLAAGVRAAFAFTCHQIDGRSFHVHDIAFAVCQRCTGLYAGLALGALVWPLARTGVERWLAPRVLPVLLVACMPLGIDWALGATGLWANTPLSQAATGAVLGVVAGLLAARGASQRVGPPGAGLSDAAGPASHAAVAAGLPGAVTSS